MAAALSVNGLLLAACSSPGDPGSARNLEQQAAAAMSRPEATRSAARVEPSRDGRLALVTDGWGRPLPPPQFPAAAPAATQAPAPPPPQAARPVVAAPVAPAMAPPAAAATVAAPANPEAALRKTLDEWRTAWARGDADSYMKFYDPQFRGTSSTRAEWEAQRRERLANRNIQLELSDVRIIRASAEEADLRFVQHYRSAKHSDNGLKHMQLRRVGSEWKIVAEAWIRAKQATPSLRKAKPA